MAVRGFSLKLFYGLVCLVVFSLGSVASAGSASGDVAEGIATEVKELDFDSYDEFFDWLTGLEAEGVISAEEFEEILDQVEEAVFQQEIVPQQEEATPQQACLSVSASPTSISVTKPFRFKVLQIQYTISVGNCGNILCGSIKYYAFWVTAPGVGGLVFGPDPSASRGQICQGGSDTAEVMVILTASMPNGTWTLRFQAIGFGGIVATADTAINVTGP